MEISNTARQVHFDALVIDAHVHPSLKTYLLKKETMESLFHRGVCMLTLAHVYQNEVVAPLVGIPKDMLKLSCFKQPKDLNLGLGEHDTKNGFDSVVAAAKHIADIGGIDTGAFGSDFDGFTDPPDDIKDISQVPRLTGALLKAGFRDPDVEKILRKNMERVLRLGWR